jgi:hypothetical protein
MLVVFHVGYIAGGVESEGSGRRLKKKSGRRRQEVAYSCSNCSLY